MEIAEICTSAIFTQKLREKDLSNKEFTKELI